MSRTKVEAPLVDGDFSLHGANPTLLLKTLSNYKLM